MSWRVPLTLLTISLAALCACTTRRQTHSERTATQQILMTEAIDRSLAKLPWSPMERRRVYVRAFSAATKLDQKYLKGAVEALLAKEGAQVVSKPERADLVLTVLAGAVGTDSTEKLFGTPRIENVIATIPELAIYKSDTQQGFAKIHFVIQDARDGRYVDHSPAAQATAYVRTRRILFFSRYETDTTRLDLE